MKLAGIVALTALSLSCGPTTRAQDLTQVKSDIASVQSEIQAAQTEDGKYIGGLIKSLIDARIGILRQTEAMLQQRLISMRSGIPIKYLVDGRVFSLPALAQQMLRDVDSEIAANEERIQSQQAEVARYSGGLVKATSSATLAVLQQTHAMLEQKRVALKYGLPQYIGFADAAGKGTLAPTAVAPNVKDMPDVLRKTITLSVIEKGFIPSNASARRYEDLLTIKCSYENISDKDIRAFTGAVIFQDLFGREIFKTGITISEPIGTGRQATWDGTIKYNQFMDTHQRLRGTELRDMKVVWSPASIIFSDGARVGEGSSN